MIISPELPSSPRGSRSSLDGRLELDDPDAPGAGPGRPDSEPPRLCRFPSEFDDVVPVLEVDDVGACMKGKHKEHDE